MSYSETAYYLYCLTPSGCRVPGSAVGVDGQTGVSVRACGEISAVFSEVELEEFCGEAAETRLQDLAWLGPRVCRHEAVIEEVMRQASRAAGRFRDPVHFLRKLAAVWFWNTGRPSPDSSLSSATNRSGPSKGC